MNAHLLSLILYAIGGVAVGYVSGLRYSKWRKSVTYKCGKCGVPFKSKEAAGCGRCKPYPTLDELKTTPPESLSQIQTSKKYPPLKVVK